MIVTSISGFVVAVVFTTGRIMAMSDEFASKIDCENSIHYKMLADASNKTKAKNQIICTNKVDIK